MKMLVLIFFLSVCSLSSFALEGRSYLDTMNEERFLRLNEITNFISNICRDRENQNFQKECINKLLIPTMLDRWSFKESIFSLKKAMGDILNSSKYVEEIEDILQLDKKNTLDETELKKVIFAILNVESLFHDYDIDQSSSLSYAELTELFKLYRQEFLTQTGLAPEKEQYALSLFLYITIENIDLNNIDQMTFYSFHKCATNSFCRNSYLKLLANRTQIARTLSLIKIN